MTFSHPWGAAAAVAIVRGVFGVTPASPGFGDLFGASADGKHDR